MTNPDISKVVEGKWQEFEKGMGDGSLFRTKLNYNNMAVQYARVPEIQNWLRQALTEMYELGREEKIHMAVPSEFIQRAHDSAYKAGISQERERILEIVDKDILESLKYFNEKAPDKCSLCWEDDYCYHKYQREALQKLRAQTTPQ